MATMGAAQDHDVSPWGAPDVVAKFATRGFTDAGEALALGQVDDQAHGDVLDLGVGGGRTTDLLLPMAASYVGIDVSREMVGLARSRFPEATLQVGDASDLNGLPSGHFDLVVFSFNGLDAVDHERRLQALAEMRRVVAPGGRVLFSSLNLDGVSFDESPLRVAGGLTSPRFRYHWREAARHPSSLVRSVRNHRRARASELDGPGWAMRPLRAFEFRFLVHFATLGEIVAEARAAGLTVVAAYADDGRALDVDAQRTDADYVHLVCAPG